MKRTGKSLTLLSGLVLGWTGAMGAALANETNNVPVQPAPRKEALAILRAETRDSLKEPVTLASAMSVPAAGAASSGRQIPGAGLLSFPFRPHLRLGAMLSPRTGGIIGVDVAIPALHILPGSTTRIDADYIITGTPDFNNFDHPSFIPVTFDQVYTKGLLAGNKLYFGAGIGPYFGNVTRFGGKAFVGAELFSRVGVEATVHFAGIGDPLVTAQVRLAL